MAPQPDVIVSSLEKLRTVGHGWETGSVHLHKGDDMINDLKFSRIQFGIFQIPWDRYTGTAGYAQDRFREGSTELANIGKALAAIEQTYEQEERDGVHRMKGLY